MLNINRIEKWNKRIFRITMVIFGIMIIVLTSYYAFVYGFHDKNQMLDFVIWCCQCFLVSGVINFAIKYKPLNNKPLDKRKITNNICVVIASLITIFFGLYLIIRVIGLLNIINELGIKLCLFSVGIGVIIINNSIFIIMLRNLFSIMVSKGEKAIV